MKIIQNEEVEQEKLGNIAYGSVFKFDGRYYLKIKPMNVEHPRYDANINRMVLDFELNEIRIMQVNTFVTEVDAQLVVKR